MTPFSSVSSVSEIADFEDIQLTTECIQWFYLHSFEHIFAATEI